MAENIIRIDSGLQKYTVTCIGSVDVFYNPTDLYFAERLFEEFEELDKKQQEYADRAKNAKDAHELFLFGKEIDVEMKARLNAVFGDDVSTPLLGSMHSYAFSDGLPIWAAILFAIIDTMDDSFEEQKKRSEAKIKKYTERYQSKAAAGSRYIK